jgi:hypothetical protein
MLEAYKEKINEKGLKMFKGGIALKRNLRD